MYMLISPVSADGGKGGGGMGKLESSGGGGGGNESNINIKIEESSIASSRENHDLEFNEYQKGKTVRETKL